LIGCPFIVVSRLLVRETKHHVVVVTRGQAAVEVRRDVFMHTTLRSRPVVNVPGGPRQQPQRRHGVGAPSDLLRPSGWSWGRSL